MARGTGLKAALYLLAFCVGCSAVTPEAKPAPTVTVVAVERVTERVTAVETYTEYVTEVPASPATRPDEATINQFAKSMWRCYLDREPSAWELADAREAFYGFWAAKRDVWAATVEWFEERYRAEIRGVLRAEGERVTDCILDREP